ncbi:efflux RND transporter periplasmic adaptor subunit [Inmirania thermothiophila]|uniref:HlyD family secretion protein n=1 Tax=Inmirania thermothiophila TaxID=1750597 RepID=A0A3N1Y717_9GAMM|nr:efflux RND transporter periplasmic adaptor subunit [Inmirania thermothiophila]ROR34606.1 HlyD family secretion protein [Inmirania thermothiophila]
MEGTGSHAPRRLLALLLLAGAAAALWWQARPVPPAVELVRVGRGVVEATVANTRAGTVEAVRRARLAPPVGGQVARLLVREGERVAAGALLLELRNDDLAARLALARREAEAARARAEEACSRAATARREADRQLRLHAQGLVAEEVAERAAGEARAAEAACRAAEAGARVAEARIAVAEAELERTRLRAPFAGVVAEINAALGEYVTPSPPGVPTPPAVDLIDDGDLYVSAPIDEVDAAGVALDMPVRVTLDAFPGRTIPGRVRRIAPYVLDRERQARTVEVEVALEDRTGLLPGYSADVEIVRARREGVLRIPAEAVLEGRRVLVFDEAAGVLRAREVRIGLGNWAWVEVLEGLREGERIVHRPGQEGLGDGVAVRPRGPR